MDLNTKSILISVFQLAEKGKLNKVEQKQIVSALFSFGMHRLSSNINTDNIDAPTQIENIEESFKKIRLGTRKL